MQLDYLQKDENGYTLDPADRAAINLALTDPTNMQIMHNQGHSSKERRKKKAHQQNPREQQSSSQSSNQTTNRKYNPTGRFRPYHSDWLVISLRLGEAWSEVGMDYEQGTIQYRNPRMRLYLPCRFLGPDDFHCDFSRRVAKSPASSSSVDDLENGHTKMIGETMFIASFLIQNRIMHTYIQQPFEPMTHQRVNKWVFSSRI